MELDIQRERWEYRKRERERRDIGLKFTRIR